MLDLDALEISAGAPRRPDPHESGGITVPELASMNEIVEASQRQAIRQALALHDQNWAAAARHLQLDASNLHKLARRLGIKA